MAAGGKRVAAGNVDRVAIGLGARDVFGRNVADCTDLVLDNDGTIDLARIFSARKRAMTSGPLPAAKPTMKWISCDGYVCAFA